MQRGCRENRVTMKVTWLYGLNPYLWLTKVCIVNVGTEDAQLHTVESWNLVHKLVFKEIQWSYQKSHIAPDMQPMLHMQAYTVLNFEFKLTWTFLSHTAMSPVQFVYFSSIYWSLFVILRLFILDFGWLVQSMICVYVCYFLNDLSILSSQHLSVVSTLAVFF